MVFAMGQLQLTKKDKHAINDKWKGKTLLYNNIL